MRNEIADNKKTRVVVLILRIFLCLLQFTMKDLLVWVRTNLIKERPEMFMKCDSV